MEITVLEAQITELVGHLNSANYRLLTLLAEFDRRKGWADSATQSCAHWLNWKCGIDIGAAREKVRVAHALVALPRISAAMERGELSYSKVRAITRIANEATEELLLSIAPQSCLKSAVRNSHRATEGSRLELLTKPSPSVGAGGGAVRHAAACGAAKPACRHGRGQDHRRWAKLSGSAGLES
jgi:hypothetical protein